MPNQNEINEVYDEVVEKGELPIDINGWRGRAELEGAWRRLAERLTANAQKLTDDLAEAA